MGLWAIGGCLDISYHGRGWWFRWCGGFEIVSVSLQPGANPREVAYYSLAGWHARPLHTDLSSQRFSSIFGDTTPGIRTAYSPDKLVSYRCFILPFYASAVAIGLPTAILLLCRRKATTTLCSICGYDNRATESGICPECGSVIPQDQIERLRRAADRGTGAR